MHGLQKSADVEARLTEEDEPRAQCSEVPGRRVAEVAVDSRPRAFAPTVDVGRVGRRNHRVKRLNDERTAGIQ